jgi:hypothetical protein
MTPLQIIMAAGGVIGVLTAGAAAWVQMGGAIPASQQLLYETASGLEDKITKVEAEGKAQSEQSAKWGRKIYSKEVHDLLIIQPPTDPVQRQYWKESIEDAKRWQKHFSDKELEFKK